MNEIKEISSDIYNKIWQILIDSLLQIDYKERLDINQVIKFLEDELNNKGSMENLGNKMNRMNLSNKNNIIKGEIYIKKENINKYIQIINSFENYKREQWVDEDVDLKCSNEKEIKENIEIKINGKLIEFTYYYQFNKEGTYIIEYSFKNNLTKTCYMFCHCDRLISLDLSNFNTQNVNNKKSMFYDCNSLTNLDLSNFNTQNVNNMNMMFYDCYSLISLDLSNFNTQNVTNMRRMFYECNSLISLDLSNFNTQNVIDMSYMFYECNSLISLDLSNFNTQNVTNMYNIFYDCNSIKKENIITKNDEILKEFANK